MRWVRPDAVVRSESVHQPDCADEKNCLRFPAEENRLNNMPDSSMVSSASLSFVPFFLLYGHHDTSDIKPNLVASLLLSSLYFSSATS